MHGNNFSCYYLKKYIEITENCHVVECRKTDTKLKGVPTILDCEINGTVVNAYPAL